MRCRSDLVLRNRLRTDRRRFDAPRRGGSFGSRLSRGGWLSRIFPSGGNCCAGCARKAHLLRSRLRSWSCGCVLGDRGLREIPFRHESLETARSTDFDVAVCAPEYLDTVAAFQFRGDVECRDRIVEPHTIFVDRARHAYAACQCACGQRESYQKHDQRNPPVHVVLPARLERNQRRHYEPWFKTAQLDRGTRFGQGERRPKKRRQQASGTIGKS